MSEKIRVESQFELRNVIVRRYTMAAIYSNMYLVMESPEAMVIDPCVSAHALEDMRERNIKNVTVLLTHEHFDHISGVNWLRDHFSVKVICSGTCGRMIRDPDTNFARLWSALLMDKSPEEKEQGHALEDLEYACSADLTYENEIRFNWCGHDLKMTEAPGHSPGGSLILMDGAMLFSGDNLVEGTNVICRLPYGNRKQYVRVTRPMLERLPDDTFVFPGHGNPGTLAQLKCYTEQY